MLMDAELATKLTEDFTIYDLFEMCDMNENATEKEIISKTDSVINSYLQVRNSERANLFQEVKCRLLAHIAGSIDLSSDHHVVPVPTRIDKRVQYVSIHSQFRADYNKDDHHSTNFKFMLPEVIQTLSMRVVALEIPRVFNTISSAIGNNTMVVYSSNNKTKAWRITLPDGNYDVLSTEQGSFDTNIEKINAAIGDAMQGGLDHTTGQFTEDAKDGGPTLTYSVDELTQTSIFESSDNSIDTIRFNVDESGDLDTDSGEKFKIGTALGFRYGEQTFETTLTSESATFLSGPRYWFLSIDDNLSVPNNTPFVVAYNEWSSTNNILSRIALTDEYENRVIRTHLSQARTYKGTAHVKKLHIQLLDEYGQTVDLNHMDWSFVLEFEIPDMGWES